jgi:RNA polymerase sigma factor (sigma-70 family)
MKEKIHINSRVIEKCLDGDIKAQFQLYKQYSKAMYNIAIRFLDNKMDAEDILQESFITAFTRLGELQNRELFGGWLKRIVINNCISFHRKRKIAFEDMDEERDQNETVIDEELLPLDPALVHHAIRELPRKGRAVLILRALEGYSHKEIAEELRISVSTSKTQYSRALSLLNRKLKGKADGN